MKYLGLFFLLYMNIYLSYSQSDQCRNFESCAGCIQYSQDKCVWCSAKDHKDRRCTSKGSLNVSVPWCNEEVYDPKPSELISSLEKDFNDGKDGNVIVQFKPQTMKIKVRTGVPVDIKMFYKPAKDYPLDIYYLMDYSFTMKQYAQNLQDQGFEIYEKLTKITNNVRLGIGSFVEKPDLPYVDVSTQISYSFKHHLSLTDNMTLFTETLKSQVPTGSNNDIPEAGLDALMQAMVCKKEVGWRDKAHRIILLSTDSTYHSAGDGKFVGAVEPNDMQCHLEKNEYSMALKLDYPSLSKINKISIENNIMIIFAVTSNFQNDYKVLEKKIQNAKYVPLLDKENIVNMIVEEYEKLVEGVLIDANVPPFMSLTFNPDCTIKDKCSYKRDPIEVVGTLTMNSCQRGASNDFKHLIKIGPAAIDEKLLLEIEAICECECEKPGKGEKNSEFCSKAGTYQCGICKCNENSYGNTCNCNGTTSMHDLDQCKANSADSSYCSGRGTCSCGKCVDCQKGFSGDFCEFDNNSCPRPGGLLCSGHGNCSFGRCECEPHWLPDDCRCPDSERSCIAPHAKEPCSGRGKCICGECKCDRNTTSNEYCSGRFCDECEELAAERCKDLQDYAYCNFIGKKEDCDLKFNFTDTDVVLINKTDIYSPSWYIAKMWCNKVLDDNKILVFKYHYKTSGTSTLLLIIQNELDEPAVADVWIAVGSVIGAVLLIGLLTIIAWKVLVDLHDKREYEKFAKAAKSEGYVTENVLYQSPVTTFSNPACDIDVQSRY